MTDAEWARELSEMNSRMIDEKARADRLEKEKGKHCPMNPSTDELLVCSQEKCAWWDEDAQACALLVIARQSKKK